MESVGTTPRVVRRGPFLALSALTALGIGALGLMVSEGATGATATALVEATPWLFFAAVAAPALLAIAARPQRGILLLLALVPFNGLLLVVPGRPPFIEGWKEALAIFTFVWALMSVYGKGRVRERPMFAGPVMAYVGLGLVSAVVVAVMTSPIQAAIGLKVGYFWLVAALAAWLAPLDERDRDRAVSLLMATGLLTSIYGIAQQSIGHETLNAWGYEYNQNIRFTGAYLRSISSFPTPFNFAFFLTLVILVGIPVALDDLRRPRNQLFLASLPVVLLALGFTFVRGAWLALGVGLVVLAIRRYRALLIPAPFALLGLLALPGTFSASAFQGESFNDRTVGWGANLTKLLDAPFGRGIGTTGASAEKLLEVQGSINLEQLYQPDNQYFKAIYEIGVPGLFLYIFVLVSIVVTLIAAERRMARPDRALAMGVSANVVGAMVASLVATWLEIFPNEFYLWLLATVAFTAARPESA
jgi:O-Antigen ligase